MIADSPYDFSGLVLKPLAGVLVGLIGSSLMLGTLAVLQPITEVSPNVLLHQIRQIILPARWEPLCEGCLPLVGLGVHLFIGMLLGLFYALCQQSIPTHGLVGVGIFYGFVVWVIGSVLLGWFFGEQVRGTLRSWPWLISHLVYGLSLAASAIWAQKKGSGTSPKDIPLD